MSNVKSGSERQLKATPTIFNDGGSNSSMNEDAAKTSSGKQSPKLSCTESSATTLQCQQKHQHIQQHLHHSPSHLSLAKSLSDVSEALDTFFDGNKNTGATARPKRQQTTATTAEALRTAAKYDDGACMQQKRANADADLLSMLEDPKGIATDGTGRSFGALDDVFMLPGNSWSDMVHEMESEKKSRVVRKG